MKAKLLLLFLIIFVYAYAKESSLEKTENNKTEIILKQLPKSVSVGMKKTKYISWTVLKIYKVSHQSPNTATQYEIYVEEANEIVVLTFDAAGQLLMTDAKREG